MAKAGTAACREDLVWRVTAKAGREGPEGASKTKCIRNMFDCITVSWLNSRHEYLSTHVSFLIYHALG